MTNARLRDFLGKANEIVQTGRGTASRAVDLSLAVVIALAFGLLSELNFPSTPPILAQGQASPLN